MTGTSRTDLLRKVDALIAELSGPLPKAERKHGWDEETQELFLDFFQRLRHRLADPKPFTEEERSGSLIRTLDSWGISMGQLLETAADISVDLLDIE